VGRGDADDDKNVAYVIPRNVFGQFFSRVIRGVDDY